VNGRDVTIIKGAAGSNGSNDVDSVRGVYLGGGLLAGFTVANGYTMASGDYGVDRPGAGIWLTDFCTVLDCIVSGNSASGDGGGVYSWSEYQSDGGALSNCIIRGNKAVSGGGVHLCTGEMTDCLVENNFAGGTNSIAGGGGAFVGSAGLANNCIFRWNTAASEGGGAHVYMGGMLKNCTLSNNSAPRGGGAHLIWAELINCVLINNSADYGGGAYGHTEGRLNNCTVARNSANYDGGGVWLSSGGLYNCIIYRNKVRFIMKDIYRNGAFIWNTFAYDGITNGVDGCIKSAASPFVNSLTDFRLGSGVPCINAGNNTYAPAGTDLAGNPRIIDGIVDMGAYEFFVGTNDFDSDGLPNEWESDHFGNITNAVGSATCSNGVNNVREAYIAGLDPNDPESKFLASVLRSPTSSILGWNATSGRVYAVQWSTNLLDGFQPLETNIAWTAGGYTDSVYNAHGQLFYKIDVQMD